MKWFGFFGFFFFLISRVLVSCEERKYDRRVSVCMHAVPRDLKVRLCMFTFES